MAMTRPSQSSTCAIAALLALGLTALAAGGAAAQAPGAGDPVRGKDLYHANGCYGCHGFTGQTGARKLVGTGSPIIAKPETFVFFLRQRGSFLPMTPSTNMPRFSEKAVSNQQALDIYAYIRTFVLDAPDVKTIPAFDKIQASAAAPYKPAK
jgi:mono/diheme cytochrome c family protein